MQTLKICCKCHVPKDLSEFAKDKHRKDGHTYDCKECRRAIFKQWMLDHPEKHKATQDRYAPYRKEYYQRPEQVKKYLSRHLKQYNLTVEQYEKMLDLQRNVCYVCNRPEPQERNKRLAVDHNHKTGQVRKLLCSTCNRAIGLLGEDINLIEKLKQYLIQHEKHPTALTQ